MISREFGGVGSRILSSLDDFFMHKDTQRNMSGVLKAGNSVTGWVLDG